MLRKSKQMIGRPTFLKERIPTMVTLERSRLDDFREYCREQGVNVSEGIRQLIEQELESQKKVEGESENIPILKSYKLYNSEAKNSLQSDIRQWLNRNHAVEMARKVPMGAQEWRHVGDTCHIIARKKETGYL